MGVAPNGIAGFESRLLKAGEDEVFVSLGGAGPPVLLLHGFPETHLMWHRVAPLLARDFSVIAADLPGYGASSCPADAGDHAAMAKHSLAAVLVKAMATLGHDRFAVAGHDRGGRVGYRMALDFPQIVTRLAVLDVVPTGDVWDRADARLTLAFWPFSLLAQPAPLPERLLAAAPDAVVDDALSNWGTPGDAFPAAVRQAYIDALRDPAHVHAICEEYRAAATLDRDRDHADAAAGRRISCPVLVLWSAEGALGSWYEDAGGPLGLWRRWADDVEGEGLPGGHFFPEEMPVPVAKRLRAFLAGQAARAS